MTILEYSKMILEKVSFNPKIFRKELRKALRQATKEDFKHLKVWCRTKFGGIQKYNAIDLRNN